MSQNPFHKYIYFKSVDIRQILYDFTYILDLKKKKKAKIPSSLLKEEIGDCHGCFL